jgi:putative Mn2+ efflux pump MntP
MPDTAIGFVLLGVGILVVLGIVFAIASRGGSERAGATPPRGVHLPAPSYLPVAISISAALIGAGLAFRGDGQLANPFLAIPGAAVFVAVSVAWVRAANHEWRDTEHGSHDDGAPH